MKAIKGATSSDAPSTFKTQGSAVLDRTMGPNFPVVYDPDPRYCVRTPRDEDKERSDNLRERGQSKGTNVSYQTPADFKISHVQVEPPTIVNKKMCVDNTYGWKPEQGQWKSPYNLPQSYMVPANNEAEGFRTGKDERIYGTTKEGELPSKR